MFETTVNNVKTFFVNHSRTISTVAITAAATVVSLAIAGAVQEIIEDRILSNDETIEVENPEEN